MGIAIFANRIYQQVKIGRRETERNECSENHAGDGRCVIFIRMPTHHNSDQGRMLAAQDMLWLSVLVPAARPSFHVGIKRGLPASEGRTEVSSALYFILLSQPEEDYRPLKCDCV